MTTANGGGRSREVLLGLLTSGVSILLIFGVYLVRFEFFVRDLKGYEEVTSADYRPPVFPKLTDREVANLGWAHSVSDHPDSSYINFPAEKPPGVVRIGTFGDSNTAGSEVAPNHDYPSFLQRRFDRAGFENVEVINFGVGSYGMHQSYLMWKTLGEKFDLDIVILMPFHFHDMRDETFIKDPRLFTGVHARYILAGDGVELIETIGEDPRQASRRYFSLIPAGRYLRYDRKPPPFLRAVIPKKRRLRSNPFYYDPDCGGCDEIPTTYSILFRMWADEVENLVITARPHPFFDDLSERLSSTGIHMVASRVEKLRGSSLYRAPITHWSALGQDLRGEELFAYLTGEVNPSPTFLRVLVGEADGPGAVGSLPALSEYAEVSVSIGDLPVAIFMLDRSKGKAEELRRELDFAETKTASLLQGTGARFPFVPISFPLIDGDVVALSFLLGEEEFDVPIGRVEARSTVLGRIELEDSGLGSRFEKRGDGWSVLIEDGNYLERLFIRTEGTLSSVKLLVGGRSVLLTRQSSMQSIEKGDAVGFHPKDRPFAYLRAGVGQYVDVESLAAGRGSLELTLKGDDGDSVGVPMDLGYELIPGDSRPFDSPYPHPIVASGRTGD